MVSIISFNIESGCNQTQYLGKKQIYRIFIFNLLGPGELKMRKNKSKGLPSILMYQVRRILQWAYVDLEDLTNVGTCTLHLKTKSYNRSQ